ncbi:MAG: methyltransferase domain-containing protein, partial [Pseudomonadota bacterium]
AGHVLELGCGAGTFAEAYLARNPTADYTGVELDPASAARAREVIGTVIEGDVETPEAAEALRAARPEGGFDLLIIGDVLEHLRDPWTVMALLSDLMAPRAEARICIPNVGHWSLLLKQMRGDWVYTKDGLLDRTHLRFFTRQTAQSMFEQVGWTVDSAYPRIFRRSEGLQMVEALAGIEAWPDGQRPPMRGEIEENLLPLQWVFSLSRGRVERPLKIIGHGMKTNHEAMVDVRLRRPLRALSATGDAQGRLLIGGAGPINAGADVAWFYRTHIQKPERANAFADAGGLLLLDIDDHPEFLPNHVKDGFLTIRGVHGVTTSTPALAEVIKTWNPEVHVIENAVLDVAPPRPPKPPSEPLHIVYAALNRTEDWSAQCNLVPGFLAKNPEAFRVTVAHDTKVAGDLLEVVEVDFFELLSYGRYLELLGEADVVLMPLRAGRFNSVKSDLKVVESIASGALPIVSPEVAKLSTVPAAHFMIADGPDAWVAALAAARDVRTDKVAGGQAHIRAKRCLRTATKRRLEVIRDLRARLPELETARRARLGA